AVCSSDLGASRRMRSPVERGNMPYSAVPQPLPELRIQPGTRSSRLAVQSTWVSPNLTRHEPSACLEKPRSKEIARISSGWRLDGRMISGPVLFNVPGLVAAATARRKGKGATGRAFRARCVHIADDYILG